MQEGRRTEQDVAERKRILLEQKKERSRARRGRHQQVLVGVA
jgi:hypothetical protein